MRVRAFCQSHGRIASVARYRTVGARMAAGTEPVMKRCIAGSTINKGQAHWCRRRCSGRPSAYRRVVPAPTGKPRSRFAASRVWWSPRRRRVDGFERRHARGVLIFAYGIPASTGCLIDWRSERIRWRRRSRTTNWWCSACSPRRPSSACVLAQPHVEDRAVIRRRHARGGRHTFRRLLPGERTSGRQTAGPGWRTWRNTGSFPDDRKAGRRWRSTPCRATRPRRTGSSNCETAWSCLGIIAPQPAPRPVRHAGQRDASSVTCGAFDISPLQNANWRRGVSVNADKLPGVGRHGRDRTCAAVGSRASGELIRRASPRTSRPSTAVHAPARPPVRPYDLRYRAHGRRPEHAKPGRQLIISGAEPTVTWVRGIQGTRPPHADSTAVARVFCLPMARHRRAGRMDR